MMNKKSIKSSYEGKELSNAERTAVHIRRLEYSTEMKKSRARPLSKKLSSIILIQQWWKTIFSFIRIQRFFRGWIFRKKLMTYLDNEEALIEKILSIERNCNKLLMKRFVWKLGKEASCTLRSLILPVKDIAVTKQLTKKGVKEWKPIQLRSYFTRWRSKEVQIRRRMIVSLLKVFKIRKTSKMNAWSQEKINKAIELIRKGVLKKLITSCKSSASTQPIAKKKEKVLKTFENKLPNKLIEKEPEESALRTIPVPTSPMTIETSVSSSHRFAKSKDVDKDQGMDNLKLNKKNKTDNEKDKEIEKEQQKEREVKQKKFDSKPEEKEESRRKVNDTFQEREKERIISKGKNHEMSKEKCKEMSKDKIKNLSKDKDNEMFKEKDKEKSKSIDKEMPKDKNKEKSKERIKIDKGKGQSKEKNKSKSQTQMINNKKTGKEKNKCIDDSNIKALEKEKIIFIDEDFNIKAFEKLNTIVHSSPKEENENDKSKEIDKEKLRVSQTEEEKLYEHNAKLPSLLQYNMNIASNLLIKHFNYWKEIALKRNIIKKASRRKRLNDNIDKVKEAFDKWKRYINHKFNQIQIASLLIVLHHNNELNKVLNNKQPTQLNNPIILNFPLNNKLKRDISSISEREDECSLDSNLLPSSHSPTKRIDLNTGRNSLKSSEGSKSNVASRESEKKKDSQSFVYLKKKPAYNLNLENCSEGELQQHNSHSITGSEGEQLDKNANQIQYDESLTTKEQKMKVMHGSLMTVVSNCFEIMPVSSPKNVSIEIETQTEVNKETRDIGVGTKDILKEKMIESLLKSDKRYLKQCLKRWKDGNWSNISTETVFFILKSVIARNSQKSFLKKIEENKKRILQANAFHRWNTKRLLPQLMLSKKKENLLVKLALKKKSNSLYYYFIHFYTQVKALTLEELDSFTAKCQKTIDHNYLSYSFNQLRQEKNILKKIVLKSRPSQKPSTTNSFKLKEAFAYWKSIVFEEKSMMNINICNIRGSQASSIKPLLMDNSRNNNSIQSASSNHPITFRHPNDLNQSEYEINYKEREIDSRGRQQVHRSHHISSSIDAKRYQSKLALTESSRLNTEMSKKESNKQMTLPSRHRSFDLIQTKNETLRPTIYSSQSFYLTKDDLQSKDTKVNLQSNFYSMFKLSQKEKKKMSNMQNPRIQVTKATIAYDDERDEDNFSSPEVQREIQSTIMNSCQNDLQSLLHDNNKEKEGYHFTVPIKEQALIQSNAEQPSDQIKKLALINYDKVLNMSKGSICHRKNNSFSAKSNICQIGNDRKRSFDKEIDGDGAFQLKEINYSQYYHSPVNSKCPSTSIKEPPPITRIYTNVTKSSKRGKMPIFHSKKMSINNTSVDVLSLTFNNNEGDSALCKFETVNKSFNPLYLSNTFYESKPSVSNRQDKISHRHNKSLGSHLFTGHDSPFSQTSTQGNIFDSNNTQYSHRPFDTLSSFLSYNFTDDFIRSTPQENSLNQLPQLIQSKMIHFKSPNDNKTDRASRLGQSPSQQVKQVNMKINWGLANLLISKQFYEKFNKRLLLNRLGFIASELNKHFNLCYLMKVTLVHRSSAQVNLIKEVIVNWQQTLRRYNKKQRFAFKPINSLNSLIFIGAKDDKAN